MPDNQLPVRSPADPAARWAAAEAVVARWQNGDRPDAAAALRDDPDLAADREVALHLAHEEYALRWEAGERVSAASFVARFPVYKASLKKLLSVYQFLYSQSGGRPPRPDRWPAPGDKLHQFAVVREIGRGAFARVYLARETTAGDRGVVLKVSAAGPAEAHALGAHPHPHVVPLFAAPPTDGLSVVVMPYLGTATLEDVRAAAWPDAGPPPATAAAFLAGCRTVPAPGDPPLPDPAPAAIAPTAPFATAVAALGTGLADALAFLHGKGLAHRDLKPSNVLLGPTGHPYLLDFNLSARTREAPAAVAGTIPYMAPEQLDAFAGDGPAGYDPAAADVFALGVILYELLTGRHPFPVTDPGSDPTAAARAVSAAQVHGHAPARSANPAVAAAVARCLALDPAARPSAAAVAAELRRVVNRRPWRRSAIFAAVTALAVATAAGAAVGVITRPGEPTPAVRQAGPYDLGLEFVEKRQFGLAATEFLRRAEANKDGRAYAYAAYCFAEQLDYEGAVWSSDRAIECGVTDPVVYTNRAFAHFRLNHLTKALDDSNTAIATEAGCLEARFVRAEVAVRFDELTGARELFPQAITDLTLIRAHRPRAADASRLAAKIYAKTGDRDRAAAAVQEAVERGCDPGALGRDPVLKAALTGHPIYERAVKADNGAQNQSLLPLRPRY